MQENDAREHRGEVLDHLIKPKSEMETDHGLLASFESTPHIALAQLALVRRRSRIRSFIDQRSPQKIRNSNSAKPRTLPMA